MEVRNYNFEPMNQFQTVSRYRDKIFLFTIPAIQLIQNKIFALIHENP